MYARILFGSCALVCLLLARAGGASAHLPNQPPYVKVDGLSVVFNVAGYASLPEFTPPDDAAPKPVAAGTAVTFTVDTEQLPVFPDELRYVTYSWRMGGKELGTASELKLDFPAGSHELQLFAGDSRYPDPAVRLTAVLVQALPDPAYRLPQAVIEVDGRRSTDLATDILPADFRKAVDVSAARSTPGSSPIVSYEWDFGDRQLGRDGSSRHRYDPLMSTVQPLLRITDARGFISYATVQVRNATLGDTSVPTEKPPVSRRLPLLAACAAALVAGGSAFRAQRRRKSKDAG